MKKRLIAILCILSMTCSLFMPVCAADVSDDNTIAIEKGQSEKETIEWTSDDFSYTEFSKTLYGCDYTRQFTITGQAISGFSESGESKLEQTTDLVIPAVDESGNKIVGIADNAFSNKGLTSVTFPTGMMVDYDDTVTNVVTKRGNFIIGSSAFSGNNLTEVNLPEGVIAVLPNAFQNNQIKNVTLPHTIWWIETLSFAGNELTTVGFPKTCDFQLEIHGMAFVQNNIRWVRLPDYVEVVHKYAFYFNPGMEECPESAPEDEKEKGGVVYMYTDNASLAEKNRIHHIDKTAEAQFSWHQKLIIESSPEGEWNAEDFTFDGTTITGFSDSGILKRVSNSDLVLPDKNLNGEYITAIADAKAGGYGLFAEDDIKFDSLTLPAKLEKIGAFAFQNNGLDEIREFPNTLKEIGNVAFQTNDLKSVILPDSVTVLGSGAFATNPLLENVVLSKSLTEIPASAFGCSDGTHYMTNLTELKLHEGITKIGARAFAGNNIKEIVIPATVTDIGEYAFSTKNYLNDVCTLALPEGLINIGDYAFRNKVIEKVVLPSTVTKLYKNTFLKEYSTDEVAIVTNVYVTKKQIFDNENFPKSDYHTFSLRADENDYEWTEYDFTYGEISQELYPVADQSDITVFSGIGITGFSESGESKVTRNPNVVIPACDTDGNTVIGIAANAFKSSKQIESVVFPEDRKDFVILENAFAYNKLTEVDLSGVAYVGMYAFRGNSLMRVTFDEDIWHIATGAFYQNSIQNVEFPEMTDRPLNLDNMCFNSNQIKAVRLPDNIEKLTYYAFIQNTGMEAISEEAPTVAQKGGVVYLYTNNEELLSTANIQHVDGSGSGTSLSGTKSWVQKIIVGNMPEELKTWSISDFEITGTTIQGLSEAGMAKLERCTDIRLPDVNADGDPITEIAEASLNEDALGGQVIGKIILPDNLKVIGDYAFQNAGITSIRFPYTLTTIGKNAFEGCLLEEIHLPDSVMSVGEYAFADIEDLRKIELSRGMEEISEGMCRNSNGNLNFTEITIPEGIKEIGAYAFEGNSFSALEFPASITKIGDYSFAQKDVTSNLAEIILPEGLLAIGDYAFQNAKVESVELPYTVKNLAEHVFDNAKGPEGIVWLYTNNPEQLINNETSFYAISDSHKTIYSNLIGTGWEYDDFIIEKDIVKGWSEKGHVTRLEVKELVIPEINPLTGEKITVIADHAFAIPDDEVEQMKSGVYSPNGMIEIDIPDTVVSIGERAFRYNSLTEINLPQELIFIGASAFHGNQLEGLVIPDSVTTVGEGAFATNNITELKLSKSMTKIEAGTFSMNIRMENIVLHEGITEIGDMAFAGARFTNLEIPSTVTRIGRKAFHLHHLTELTIPGNVKELGDSAFEGTPKGITMKKLILENGIESIGSRVFACGYLEYVELPTTLKYLGTDAFIENSGINNDHKVVCYCEYSESTYELLRELELEGAVYVTEPRKLENVKATLSGGHDDVNISWNAGKHVTGAEVSYKKSSEEEWSEPLSVSGYECSIKNLDDNVTYEFMVTPYCETNGVKYSDDTQYTIVDVATKKNVAAPENTKAVLSGAYDSVKLTWSKVSGASGYRIYYKKGNAKEYTYLTATTSASLNKTKLSDGVKYTFKVIPYYMKSGKAVEGYYASTASVYTLKKMNAPTISKISVSKIKVAWNNISGETGYQISRSSTKKGTNIISTYATKTGTSKTFTVTKNKTYYYKVRAYVKVNGKMIYTPWSDVKSYNLRYVAGASNVKTNLSGYDDVKVSWGKSTGANYYYVYYKKASAAQYTYLGRTTKTYFIKKNLSDGVKYTFKIVPCYVRGGEKLAEGAGKISSIYTLKKVNPPVIKKSSGTKVNVTWKNISGESGYQISASTDKNKTNIVTTYKTTKGTSKKITIKKGKTYYYKVRAYKIVNGKKIFGPWSNVTAFKNK